MRPRLLSRRVRDRYIDWVHLNLSAQQARKHGRDREAEFYKRERDRLKVPKGFNSWDQLGRELTHKGQIIVNPADIELAQ